MPSIKRFSLFLGVMGIVSTLGVTSHTVKASSEITQPDPVALLNATHKPIAQGRGWVFASRSQRSTSPLMKPSIYVLPSTRGTKFCTSYEDATCSPAVYSRMYANVVLGNCESESETACLEGVSSYDVNGVKTPMKLVDGGATVFPESKALNGPRGATATRWLATDGTQYMVSPVVNVPAGTKDQTQWLSSGIMWFDIYLVRIPSTYSSDFLTGAAPASLKFESGSRYSVQVRLPPYFPSWFQGRLVDSKISSKQLANGSTSYDFSGSPMSIPIPYAELDYSTDPDLVTGTGGGVPTSYEIIDIEPGNSISTFKSWSKHISERAITTVQQWSAGSYAATTGKCFPSTGGAVGMMSTNAGSYDQVPPTWDVLTKQMKINVGSSHLDENGKVVVGTYSASIPLSVVQCLYGDGFIPNQAEVSVTYEDGSSTFTSAQAVSVVDGIMNLSINGFHYSAPTIGLKLKASGTAVSVVTGTTGTSATIAPTSKLKKGSSKALSSIAKTKTSQKPKWSASGKCKIVGSKVVALKVAGTCKVTLRVLNSKKKYVVQTTKTFKVS